jgi:hypothetical protein
MAFESEWLSGEVTLSAAAGTGLEMLFVCREFVLRFSVLLLLLLLLMSLPLLPLLLVLP